MKATKLLLATVIYVFFLGLSISVLAFSASRYFVGGDTGSVAAYSLFLVMVLGVFSVLCYRDLRSALLSVGAHNPEPGQSRPDPTGEAA